MRFVRQLEARTEGLRESTRQRSGSVPSGLRAQMQRLLDEPDRLQRYRDAVAPPKTLQAAVDEFEAVYADACRG